MRQVILPRIIGAIGEKSFAGVAAAAMCDFLEFDLAAVIVHPGAGPADVLFDDFDRAGARCGIENYVRFTRSVNPMLARVPVGGVCRARDFAIDVTGIRDGVRERLVPTADEELGFRTVGWPQRLEEIGLYLEACGGVVEIGLYRERGRTSASVGKLRILNALREPIAAAFERHEALASTAPAAGDATSVLSSREREVCELLLMGCSSEAIALRLNIGRYTVKDHRKRIFRKLRIGSLAELFALRARGH